MQTMEPGPRIVLQTALASQLTCAVCGVILRLVSSETWIAYSGLPITAGIMCHVLHPLLDSE